MSDNDQPQNEDASKDDSQTIAVIPYSGVAVGLTDTLAGLLFAQYKKAPGATIICVFLAILAGGVIAVLADSKKVVKSPPDAAAQIEKLRETESNLTGLIEYVQTQQKKIEETESFIKSLKDEREKLAPVVQADRKVVEGIFALQNERLAKDKWWDRGIGLVLGIVGSIIASILIKTCRLKFANKNAQAPEPAS